MNKTYRTVQGDTFDSVAYRLWGEPRLAHLLMRANPSFMEVVIFSGGVELAVPEYTPQPVQTELPPWMQ